jgi:hypothetical protein
MILIYILTLIWEYTVIILSIYFFFFPYITILNKYRNAVYVVRDALHKYFSF